MDKDEGCWHQSRVEERGEKKKKKGEAELIKIRRELSDHRFSNTGRR